MSDISGVRPAAFHDADAKGDDPLLAAAQLDDEWIRGALLILLACTAYLPAFFGGFFWDDEKHITQNAILTAPDALSRIWFKLEFQQYLPIQLTSFWAELKLFGQNPLPFHTVNILLHSLNAILIWRVLKRLSLPVPWLVAAIFALHPVNAETVAWITERRNLLAAFFYLLAVLAWLRFDSSSSLGSEASQSKTRNPKPACAAEAATARRRPETRNPFFWYAACLGLYLLALLSKTVSSSLPVILLLIGWMRGKSARALGRDGLLMLPFFAIGLPLGLLTAFMERSLIGAQGPEWAFSFFDRLLIGARALWFYALKDLFPYPLMFEYPRWKPDASDWEQWLWVAAALALIASLIPLTRRFGRKTAAALLFFGITLLPAAGLANVYPQRFSFVADHFQYLGSLGIITLAVGCGAWLLERWQQRVPLPARPAVSSTPRSALLDKPAVAPGGRPVRLACAALLAVLGAAAWLHASSFVDAESVWRDTLSKNPDAWLAHFNLGVIEYNRGVTESKRGQPESALRFYQEALRHYQEAWRSGPADLEVLAHLGDAYTRMGKAAEARETFNTALKLTPAFKIVSDGPERNEGPVYACYRAVFKIPASTRTIYEHKRILATEDVLLGLARLEAATGSLDQALRECDRAAALRPKSGKPWLARAELQMQAGKLKEALEDCGKAADLDSAAAQPLAMRAGILRELGQTDEAIAAYRKALAREPEFLNALVDLGALLKDRSEDDEAIDMLRRALHLNPDNAGALYNLGAIMLSQGKLESAGEFFRRAVLAQQNFADARLYLAVVQAAQGKWPEARALVENLRVDEISAPGGYANLALIEMKAKSYAAAEKVLRAGISRFKVETPGRGDIERRLAWLLATCPDDAVRNGKEALSLSRALSVSQPGANSLAILAAALAESGDFNAAAAAAAKAHDLATQEGNGMLAREIGNELKLYQAQRPYRDAGE